MRVFKILCPHCKASLGSKAGIESGTVIPCPKCKKKFAVKPPPDDDEIIEDFEVVDEEDEAPPPKKKPAPKPAPTEAKPNAFSKLGGEEKPKKKKRPRDDEDDDEDDDRPRKKKKKKKKSSSDGIPIWIRIVVMVLLLAGLGYAIYWRVTQTRETITETIRETNDEDEVRPPNKAKANPPKPKVEKKDEKPIAKKANPLDDLDLKMIGHWKLVSGFGTENEITIMLEYRDKTFIEVITRPNSKQELRGNWRAVRLGDAPNTLVIERTKLKADEGVEEITIEIPNANELRQALTVGEERKTVRLIRVDNPNKF